MAVSYKVVGKRPGGMAGERSPSGYYGSNCATFFGEAVPMITVQTVPLGLVF